MTQDPHAESIKTHHTSIPDDLSTSQYSKMLKIATIPDKFNNPHLVIGTSAGNYLVTSSEEEDHAYVGPGRCGQFKVSEHTRLLISQERQDQSFLDNTVFGLAQVRTGFGHPATYNARRAIMEAQNDSKTIPVTISTLHRWKVQEAKVFHQLYVRSLEKFSHGIILKRSDTDDSLPEGKIAERLAELSKLFMDNELNVTRAPMTEDILQALIISDKNRVVADNIENSYTSYWIAPDLTALQTGIDDLILKGFIDENHFWPSAVRRRLARGVENATGTSVDGYWYAMDEKIDIIFENMGSPNCKDYKKKDTIKIKSEHTRLTP
ncbi:hypothetical protein BGZ99_004292 [Dissophora globulifera]|uniref:Uncharacterized protein n=1 Tax=Dissophora globulifera TaxID=979702 RepID=A0A9P6UV93_9FUNG|nr:hypothetical protein BGZ99_004292 [Dissophora globulifera]